MFSLNKLLGLPPLHSEHGAMVDHMLEIVHWFMAVLFVGWTIFFLFVLFRFNRRRNPKANHKGVTSHFSTHLEVMVVVVEVVLLLGFAFPLWATRSEAFPTDPDVTRVRAVGEQFFWTFHYPGPDGKFGRVDPDRFTSDNSVGLDRSDPNAKDDFTSVNRLMMPLDRDVIIQVTSKDVIHGLALNKMRIQQDAIPGQEVPIWFRPNTLGEGEIICAQLCGVGHAQMIAFYEVVEGEEFDEWVKEKSPSGNDEKPAEAAE